MDNLVVVDKEYLEMAKKYVCIGRGFELRIDEYLKIMNSIIRGRLMEGATANALSAYTGKVAALRGQLLEITKDLQRLLEGYVNEINSIDKEFY